jgi:hypothetical protein
MAQHLLVCLTPGLMFTVGSLLLAESPRWLARRGRIAQARRPAAHPPCRRSAGRTARNRTGAGTGNGQPPCQRTAAEPPLRAALPAGLPGAGLTQATGINSMLAYVVNILNQAGLPGASANMADVG